MVYILSLTDYKIKSHNLIVDMYSTMEKAIQGAEEYVKETSWEWEKRETPLSTRWLSDNQSLEIRAREVK